jgi:hypothetical protein
VFSVGKSGAAKHVLASCLVLNSGSLKKPKDCKKNVALRCVDYNTAESQEGLLSKYC